MFARVSNCYSAIWFFTSLYACGSTFPVRSPGCSPGQARGPERVDGTCMRQVSIGDRVSTSSLNPQKATSSLRIYWLRTVGIRNMLSRRTASVVFSRSEYRDWLLMHIIPDPHHQGHASRVPSPPRIVLRAYLRFEAQYGSLSTNRPSIIFEARFEVQSGSPLKN